MNEFLGILFLLFVCLAPCWILFWAIEFKGWKKRFRHKCLSIENDSFSVCPSCGEKGQPYNEVICRKNIFGFWEFKK